MWSDWLELTWLACQRDADLDIKQTVFLWYINCSLMKSCTRRGDKFGYCCIDLDIPYHRLASTESLFV